MDAAMQTAGYWEKLVGTDVCFYYTVADVWTNIDLYKCYKHYYL